MSAAASAKMALAFAELTGGVKFDGKKHRAVMSRFSAKKNHGGGGGGSGSARAGEGASGSGRAGGHDSGDTSDKNKKKQKDLASRERERTRGVAERADDDAVEVFGTRRQKLGNPSGGRADAPSRGKRVKDDTRGGADRVSRDAPDASPRDTDSEAHDGSDSLETGLQAALREASAPRRAASQTEEAAAALRKKHKIRVRDAGGEGRCPPPLSGGFDELAARYPGIGCGKMLLGRLAEAGFHEPTPIQRQAIPALLENHELLAVAPTGSGKTLAFLLPIVCALRSKDDTAGGPRALLLSPTKELAQQSHRILRLLCRGVNTIRCCLLTKATQMNEMDKVDVLVATPLRLRSIIEKKRVSLRAVRYLVLDEADKLFEMGFVEQVDAAAAACDGPGVTRALFSATLPETVERLARSVMTAPMRLTIGERNAASETVEQSLVFCGQERGKLLALRQLFAKGAKLPVIVFTQSKDRAKQLARELQGDGLRLGLIHAGMSDAKRQAQVDRFRAGDTWTLVATDLMARGMDFVGVGTVVNYDFPGSPHAYVHRIGRSGRAGRPGAAVTLFTEEDAERGDLRAIANVMKNSGCDVPGWMLASGSSDPRVRRRKRKDGREDNPRREAIDPARAAAATARETARKHAAKLKDREARKKRKREERTNRT